MYIGPLAHEPSQRHLTFGMFCFFESPVLSYISEYTVFFRIYCFIECPAEFFECPICFERFDFPMLVRETLNVWNVLFLSNVLFGIAGHPRISWSHMWYKWADFSNVALIPKFSDLRFFVNVAFISDVLICLILYMVPQTKEPATEWDSYLFSIQLPWASRIARRQDT